MSDPHKALSQLVLEGQNYAYCPVSNYRVGAAALGASGKSYIGFNIEFPGVAIASTVHSEQSIVALALGAGESALTALAVSAPPCGHCRQFLNELNQSAELRILIEGRPEVGLEQLLPVAFGPADLGVDQSVLHSRPWQLEGPDSNDDPVLAAAMHAATISYAPYSGCPAGVAILGKDGRIFSGSYIENAAFNPSLPPLQSAIVHLISNWRSSFVDGPLTECFQSIRRVVLLQSPGPVDFQDASRSILASIAPMIELEIFPITTISQS
jgi:cytidine deaminase